MTVLLTVAVVIVGFRNADDIARCLAALGRASYPDFAVTIVENGGAAAFAALRAAVPGALAGGQPVRLIQAPGNLGFAGGVNLGIAESRDADAWWILNPDTVPAPGALDALVGRLVKGDCDAVGGVLHFADGRVQALGGHWQGWIGRATSIGSGSQLADPIDPAAVERRMTYLLGASMLVSRRFVDVAGVMRDDYFLYAEEIEWFLRAGQSGLRLGFAPDACVLHHQGTTTGWASRLRERGRMPTWLDERNRLLVTRDRFPARLPVVAPAALVFLLLRFGRGGAWRQICWGIGGWLAGLANRRRLPRWISP